MKELVSSFENSIFDQSLFDAGTDLLEIGIDSVIDNPFVESLPIARIAFGAGKTVLNISERHFLKQTYAFLVAFNTGDIDKKAYEEYKNRIDSDPNKGEEELGRVMIILNRSIEIKKAEILGKLFQAYVCRKIDWEEFCDFSDALDRLFISDIPLLINVLHEDIVNPEGKEAYKGDRLSAMGLVDTKTNFAETTVDVINIDRIIRITEFGRRFVQYGLSQ